MSLLYFIYHERGTTQIEVLAQWAGKVVHRYTELDIHGRAVSEPVTVTQPAEPPVRIPVVSAAELGLEG